MVVPISRLLHCGPPALGACHRRPLPPTTEPLATVTPTPNTNAQHELVLSALEKLDKGRKCFRLVGDVLVERTVGETMPAVAKNKENLEATIATIQKQFELQKKDLMEFQVGGVRACAWAP